MPSHRQGNDDVTDGGATAADGDTSADTDVAAPVEFPNPVFIEDDLTAKRAKIAFEARKLKRSDHILETWVFDSKIMIKDRYGRVSQIKKHCGAE